MCSTYSACLLNSMPIRQPKLLRQNTNMNATVTASNTTFETVPSEYTRFYNRGILITITIAYAVQIPIGIPGNLKICLLFYTREDLRKATHILLWNLSFVGVLVSATYLPLFLFVIVMVQFLRQPFYFGFGIFRYSYSMLLFGVQTLTIVAMAIERNDAVLRPYKKRITAANVRKVVLGIWLFAGLTFAAHLPLAVNDAAHNQIIYNLPKTAPSWILTLALSNIYLLGANLVVFATFIRIVKRLRSSPFAQSNTRSEVRVTRLTYYLLFSYVISWLPLIVVAIAGQKFGLTETELEELKVFLLALSNISYLVNPFIHKNIVEASQRRAVQEATGGNGTEQNTQGAAQD